MDTATRSHHDYDGDTGQQTGGTLTEVTPAPTTASIARELRAHGFRTGVTQTPDGLLFEARLNRQGNTVYVGRDEYGVCVACAIAPDGAMEGAKCSLDLVEVAAAGLRYAGAVPR